MSLQFNPIAIFLVVLIFLGVVGNNSSITIAATVLLLMQQTFLAKYLPYMEKYGLNLGIIILTVGVLAPIISGKIQLPSFVALLNWKMLLAIAIGILVAWFGGRGVGLLGTQPVLITGLLIGTIIGVSFFGGIPVGPLIAAGILSLMLGKS
jgi:Predicted membrane protein